MIPTKPKKISKALLLVTCFISLSSAPMIAQIRDTVTIDPSGSADSTIFTNWYSFWRTLQGQSRSDGGPNLAGGISGPLHVKVAGNNTIAETNPVEFPAIAGMNSTNTITIEGGGNQLLFSGSSAAIRFTGGDNFTIQNLTIRNTNTAPAGIWFNNQSDRNTISNCDIYLSNLTSSSSSTYYIAFSTSVTSPSTSGSSTTGTTGVPGSYNKITNCNFYTQSNSRGPYYGITLNGSSANYKTTAQNNEFSNNTISNFYSVAIYMYYTNGNLVTQNDISRANTTTSGSSTMYGIQSYYPYCTERSSEITGNTIHDLPYAGASPTATSTSTFYGNYIYYAYGNSSYPFRLENNTLKNIAYSTGSRYVNYIYYPQYIDVLNNTIDNVDGRNTSSTSYDWYIYYPTAVRCNGNTCINNNTSGYLYNFYIYYGSIGSYTWNEFQDNIITGNTAVTYLYAAYIYRYNGNNSFKINRNYVVGNNVTGSTGYLYFYLYYLENYQVCNNVVAGNYSNSKYIYIYSAINGGFSAEIRNNTFELDATDVPTPSSSYNYFYNYLTYHKVYYTGNIVQIQGAPKNGTNPYYRYMYMYLSSTNPANLLEFDYNTFHINNNFQSANWYFNGTNYGDWANFKNSGYTGLHDNGEDPKFLDKSNMDYRSGAWHTQNIVPFGDATESDAQNNPRNKTRHDRGALETHTDLEAISTNVSIPSIVCAGYTIQNTILTIANNYPHDVATNFNCAYSVNGGPKIIETVSEKLEFGDTAIVRFQNPLVLNDYGANRVAIYIDLPDDDNTNDSFVFYTFVKPAPGGGKFIASTKPTYAVYQYTKDNDVTVIDQPVIYNSASPRIYDNSSYGTDWLATAYAITSNGMMRPGSEILFTAPVGSQDLEISYRCSDKSMEDSLIWVCLKVTDLNNGCDTIIQRQVLIYPTVETNFTFPTVNCDGDEILFENHSKVRSGSMEFIWDFGTGNTSDITETPEPIFSFPASGTYKVRLIAKTLPYGFPSFDSALITVTKRPNTKFTHKNACNGTPLTFNSMGTSSGAVLEWSFGDNTGTSAANPTKQYTQNGGYLVSLKATENGCSNIVSKRVYQFDKPKALWSLMEGSCDNKPFIFSNLSTIANGTTGSYWNFDDGTVSALTNPEHLFTSSGVKAVKLISVSEFGCKDSLIKNIIVKESPKVAFSHTQPCSLKETEFTNETPPVAGTIANYSWVFSDGGSSALKSPKYLFNSPGPKNIEMRVELDNGCSETLYKSIVVGVQPKVDFTASSVCTGQPVVLENKTSWDQGEISYNWNFGDSTFATIRAPQKMYYINQTTTYTVTLVANIQNGCSDAISKQVTVHEGPQTCDFLNETDYQSSYHGMRMKAIDANGNPFNQNGVSYTWVIEGGGNKSGASITHDFKIDGIYQVTMIARVDGTGCECSKTKTVVMNRGTVQNWGKDHVQLYPNPNLGYFQVAVPREFGIELQMELLNMHGVVVKQFHATNTGTIALHAESIPGGTYLLRIQSSQNLVTHKVIIQP